MTVDPVRITLYRWAGQWGPFKVNIPCGECSLTLDIIKDVQATDLAGIPTELAVHDWLSNWWKPLFMGGWHAPIILVDGKVIAQGAALNRGVLTEEVIKVWTERSQLSGTVMFGKENCPHCVRAKTYLEEAGLNYTYLDVVKEPRAVYEMVPRVKTIIGHKTPVTVPQIWIDGEYIGGADRLGERLGRSDIEPNPDRGANSLAPAA